MFLLLSHRGVSEILHGSHRVPESRDAVCITMALTRASLHGPRPTVHAVVHAPWEERDREKYRHRHHCRERHDLESCYYRTPRQYYVHLLYGRVQSPNFGDPAFTASPTSAGNFRRRSRAYGVKEYAGVCTNREPNNRCEMASSSAPTRPIALRLRRPTSPC